MPLTNKSNVPLPLAVWLAVDEYDYIDKPNYYSTTTIIKEPRQVILSKRARLAKTILERDVTDKFNQRSGTSYHDSIKRVWTNPELRARGLAAMGYDQETIEAVVVNPKLEDVTEDQIPVWVEQREFRELAEFLVGGEPDLIIEDTLYDHKRTSVWTFMRDFQLEEYIKQLSIYRWIEYKKELSDNAVITMIFKDWLEGDFKSGRFENYPTSATVSYPITLLSYEETEALLLDRLRTLKKFENAKESKLPHCTDVWRGNDVYKYFTKLSNSRATRSSEDINVVMVAKAKAGGKGSIITEQGKVKRCNPKFCDGYSQCTQKDIYLAEGILAYDGV